MRSCRPLLLLCCFLLACAAAWAQEASTNCTFCEARSITCPTCNGKGTEPVPCVFCGGEGKADCRTCDPAKPGWLDCLNRFCRDGKTQWTGGDTDPCKVCRQKGRLLCPDCRGQAPPRCGYCAGSGKRASACSTCVGAKRVACPLCAFDPHPGRCTTCDNTGRVSCRLCASVDPKALVVCLACVGKGQVGCGKCLGHDRIACERCGATGKIRMVARGSVPGITGGDKAGVKTCDLCNGKAVKGCGDCTRGRTDCVRCEGGKVAATCMGCRQHGTVYCAECMSGGYSRLEALGNHLLAKGQPARAVVFFRSALEHAKVMTGPRNCRTELTELAKRLAEIDKLLRSMEALTAALGDSGKVPARSQPQQATSESFRPSALAGRFWPRPPIDRPFDPWADETWLFQHRQRTVARLEAALASASAAAGK